MPTDKVKPTPTELSEKMAQAIQLDEDAAVLADKARVSAREAEAALRAAQEAWKEYMILLSMMAADPRSGLHQTDLAVALGVRRPSKGHPVD
jgi:hypothetical protein